MRVTHVITRLIVGGAQENTIASILGLQQKPGIEARLVSGPSLGPEGSLESELGSLASPHILVPELVRSIHPWKDFLAMRGLWEIFLSNRPEIVHTHSGKAGVLGRLAAKRAGVPIIVHTIHGPSFGAFQGAFANATFCTAERYAGRRTTHFVVVAEAMKQQYFTAGIGTPNQYTTIYSGFDLRPFLAAKNDLQLRARWGLAPDDVVVGKIARLFKLKGHDDLFKVAPELIRRCPRMKFMLVGDGEWRERFQNLARAAGLEKHFVFTGLVTPADVPALVGIMDIVIHLSQREGLPRALPQALAAARPVVAYDCDGAKEVCFDNETGFLLQRGDLAGLQDQLLSLANNPELRARFGERGRDFVRQHFAVEQMVDSLYSLYQKLAAERGLPTT
jgi:glycosyltransferase involved in cell wall biosynthesis